MEKQEKYFNLPPIILSIEARIEEAVGPVLVGVGTYLTLSDFISNEV